jgi:hypothetical protein
VPAGRTGLTRRGAATGSALAAIVAVASVLSGIPGNWVANLGQPPAGVVWTVFGLAVLAAAVLAVLAARGSSPEPSGPVPVSVVGSVDSADEGCDVWPLEDFTAKRATVHSAIGRRADLPHGGDEATAEPVRYVERDHDPRLRAEMAAAARAELRALIFLRGLSSTGKTRSLFEAVHACCLPPGTGRGPRTWWLPRPRSVSAPGWVVVRPAGREALRKLPLSGLLGQAPTVLWLNELQGFLGPNGSGLSRRLLDELRNRVAGQAARLHRRRGAQPRQPRATQRYPDALRAPT